MIVPVDVNRDEHGYWTHPALTRSGCALCPGQEIRDDECP